MGTILLVNILIVRLFRIGYETPIAEACDLCYSTGRSDIRDIFHEL